MPEDTVAVVVTAAFFVVMAAWIPLVKYYGMAIKKQPKRERQSHKGRVLEMNRRNRPKTGRGYESAVLVTMIVSICSLSFLD
jgi:hypothetical protein